jgi:hypothetical protein
MIVQVEALNYLCLRYVRQPLAPFQVLIGPNASGKSTFLDAVAFLADVVREKEGVAAAVAARAPDVRDLYWMRQGDGFELIVEATIPPDLQGRRNGAHARVRYEVRVGLHTESGETNLLAETLWLRSDLPIEEDRATMQRTLFPMPPAPPAAIVRPSGKRTLPGWRRILNKVTESGNDYFRSETSDWNNLFRLGPRRSALANLPDLRAIRTVERPEDRHRYLVLDYDTGLHAPSWSVSDGTLRLLALTILAYIPDLGGIYLIEEPENGIHPRAVETVLQSLSSVYGAQVLLATHSPVILSLARPEQVLCFDRTDEGATDIVRGSEHPRLRQWRQETDLGTLFASGVLG